MTTEPALLVSLDRAETFTYALNGGLTAVHATRLDVVGVTVAMVSGLGGRMICDILLGALPPATFSDSRYLAVAAGGGLAAFGYRCSADTLDSIWSASSHPVEVGPADCEPKPRWPL